MNRDELIIACFCLIDDVLPGVLEGQRLRQRGFGPTLSDFASPAHIHSERMLVGS